MYKLMSYYGAKDKFFTPLNNIINNSNNKKIYVEPFIGSGFMFLNVDDVYDKYYINDVDENLIKIYKSLGSIKYETYKDILNKVYAKFGDIQKKNKTSFILFREYFNTHIWNNKDKNIVEGVLIFILHRTSFNSHISFNKKGVNSSFGGGRGRDCLSSYSRETHTKLYKKLAKTQILSGCALDLIISLDEKYNDGVVMFLDPPYFTRPSNVYNDFSSNEYKKFINIIGNLNCDWLYTDMEENQLLKYPRFILRNEMKKISCDGKPIKQGKEIVITNIKKR